MIVRPVFAGCVLVAACCLNGQGALSETFVLQSGERLEGRVVRSLGKTLSIKLPERGMRQLPISELERVKIRLQSGETVSGRLTAWSDQVYEVETEENLIGILDGRIVSETPKDDAPMLATKANSDAGHDGVGGPRVVLEEEANEVQEPETQRLAAVDTASDLPLLAGSSTPTREDAEEAVFSFRLSEAVSRPVVILYSAVEQAAKSGSDYRASAGVATIEPGELDVDIRVPLIDDDVAEPEESFELFLTVDPNAAELQERRLVGIIEDDD